MLGIAKITLNLALIECTDSPYLLQDYIAETTQACANLGTIKITYITDLCMPRNEPALKSQKTRDVSTARGVLKKSEYVGEKAAVLRSRWDGDYGQ